jgi:hypothetical protein
MNERHQGRIIGAASIGSWVEKKGKLSLQCQWGLECGLKQSRFR